eukprot:PhM_4_TR684/c0_g1_i1/m.41128
MFKSSGIFSRTTLLLARRSNSSEDTTPKPTPTPTRITKLRVGNTTFAVTEATLSNSPALCDYISKCPRTSKTNIPFLDMDPQVFRPVLSVLRSGYLPEKAHGNPAVMEALETFCPRGEQEDEGEESHVEKDRRPRTLVVHLADQFQQEVGVKRHALNITFGTDGFRVGELCRSVRKDLRGQIASTYWQMHQSHERSAAFLCTKIPNGTADLVLTTLTQHVINHTEKFGYKLDNAYVTMTPDPGHTKVRMLLHVLVFRVDDSVDDPVYDYNNSKKKGEEERDNDENEEEDEGGEEAPPTPGGVPFETKLKLTVGPGGPPPPSSPKQTARRMEKIWDD